MVTVCSNSELHFSLCVWHTCTCTHSQQNTHLFSFYFLSGLVLWWSPFLFCLLRTPDAALYNWVSLCKTIYQPDDSEECEGLSDCWTDYIDEYKRLKDRTPVVHNAQLDLFLDPHMIGPCDPSITIPLFALAVGATGNHQAEGVYERMMEFAKRRGKN